MVQEDEAAVVKEVFERYAHGEAPLSIIRDMVGKQTNVQVNRSFNQCVGDNRILGAEGLNVFGWR